jgi:hypothetical protein
MRPAAERRRRKVLGSGTSEAVGVNVASSKVNEPPAGSPVIVTIEMPPGELTDRNSLGLEPISPERLSYSRIAR